MFHEITSVLSTLCALGACVSASIPYDAQLPVVDLGYELQRATVYNATSDVYQFLNVRYAQAPVGNLRFRAPAAPLVNRSSIQNGSIVRTCPQGSPFWQTNAFAAIAEFTDGTPFTLSAWEAAIANGSDPGIDWTKGTMEDCLFLDIHVPRKVYERGSAFCEKPRNNASVLVWIHGGGYTLGSKLGYPKTKYYPYGLVEYGQLVSEDGMIFIAMNYRLGALGFLAGPEVEKDGNQNVGLRDQRFALEWIQENIHLFGGDAEKVTIMGESAGGGSIMYQMAAYGGANGSVPFAKAIAQSPAGFPLVSQPREAFTGFLSRLNVTTLEEARNLSSQVLIKANADMIQAGPYVSYVYNPVRDDFLPAPQSELYRTGAFDKKVKLLTGVNAFEGSFFYDPNVETESEFEKFISNNFFSMSEATIQHIAQVIYPPIFDGSLGYVDQATRQSSVFAESNIYCNALLMNDNFGSSSASYEFSVAPAIHTEDLSCSFNNPGLPNPLPYPEAQVAFQKSIVSFTTSSNPLFYGVGNNSTQPYPAWDLSNKVANFTATSSSEERRMLNLTRCDWWLEGIFNYRSKNAGG